MFSILLAIEILVSILLMIAVLMQSSKGGGLAGSFGGGSMGAVFGVRRTADFLSRSTTILASIFLGLCLVINLFFLPGGLDQTESVIQSSAPTGVPQPVPPVSQPAATPQDNATQENPPQPPNP